MDLHSFSVSARWASALLVPAALVALAPTLSAQSDEGDTYMGENPDRYASVRVLDGEATIRKGEVEESLSRGVPIAEGDVVESHGRGVLQLADGTRVAFGSDTRFQVATLFTDKDQDRQVLLRLDYGRLRIAMGRESEAKIRIDMPSGSAILADGSSASFEMERDRTARVKVLSGRMVFLNEREQASLLAGERLTVYSNQDRLDRIQNFNTYEGDAFDSWSDRSLAMRRGPSWEKVPPEIRYYSDDLDNNGEWVYVDEYRTWCWRPLRVSADWRPYWRGRWGAYPGGMTWISDEPWGYVTYHHGRWGWGAGLGWYWIPGVYYSPAWVAWQSSDAYFGWAPMGYYNRPATWGYGAWGGGYSWNVVEINFIHVERIHTHTRQDPDLIRSFNSGNGSGGWSNGPGGNRPLAHPWRQGPLVVSQNEFRHPDQMQHVFQDPNAAKNRLQTYEQQSGRTIYRRPPSDPKLQPLASPPSGVTGFEDRSHLHAPAEHPIIRSGPPVAGPRPLTQPQRSTPPPTIDRTAPGTIQREQPIQPHGSTNPSNVPPPQPPSGRTGPNRPIPRELPMQQHGPTNPGNVRPPPAQPPSGRGGPNHALPRELPIQPHGPANPGNLPPPQPQNDRPGENSPRVQPMQPREVPHNDNEQTPDGSQPPPPWLKKQRPLSRP